MASSITLKSSSYDGRYMTLVCTQKSNGSALNTSTITWTLTTAGGNSNYYSTGATTVIINGTTVYSKARVSHTAQTFPASKGSVSGTLPVSHVNDGTKSIDVSFSTAIYTSTISTYSDTWTLDTIPRYFTSTPTLTLTSKTETTATFKWTTPENCSWVRYHLDGSTSWVDCFNGGLNGGNYSPAKSGTFTVSGLGAYSSHKIYVECARADSKLWSNSNTPSFTTYNYPYCTSSPDFVIGNKLKLEFYNPLNRTINVQLIGNGDAVIGSWSGNSTTITGFADTNSVAVQYSSIPNDTSGEYKVAVTYGTSTITRNTGNTYSINTEECYPHFVGFIYKDTNETVTAVTGNNSILVAGLSTLTVEIPVDEKMTPRNYATADKYIASFDALSATIPYSSTEDVSKELGTVGTAGLKTLNVIAYDSRGLGTPAYQDITVYEYEQPVINVEVTRLNDFEAETTLKVSGSYSKLTIDGADKNTLKSAEFRYRVAGGTWSEYEPLTTTISGNKFTCSDVVRSLDNTKAFEFQIKVTDSFGDLTTSRTKATVDIGQAVFFVSTNKKECYINNMRVLHDTIMVDEADTDLNDYTTTGLYFFGADYTPLNIPAGVNGWLEVIGSENDRIKQIWYRAGTVDSNDFMTYTRTYIDGTWGVWSRLATVSQDYINDKTHIANYVIESGTSGVWYYEKYADGTVKLYGMATTAYTNPNVCSLQVNYPFELSKVYSAMGTVNNRGNGSTELPINVKISYALTYCVVWVHSSNSSTFTTENPAQTSICIVGHI